MPAAKSTFLDKVLRRINRLDAEGLQQVVQRLARERSFLEMLFNTIEDGVVVTDPNGVIIYYNQAVTRLLGVPEATAQGQNITDYLPNFDWKPLLATPSQGARPVVRHEFEVAYPQTRFLRLYATPLASGAHDGAGMMLILHDATEARQQTFAAIESERVQALTLLAASVAHEIGNPLNALNIHVQLMERELKKLKQMAGTDTRISSLKSVSRAHAHQHLAEMTDATQGIAQKLEQFLTVAKGEIGRLDYIITQFLQAIRPSPPKLQLAALNDVVLAAVDLLRPELENRGLTVQEKWARSLPMAPMDPAQIRQVVVNLVKNAMQAMTSGGVLTIQTGPGTESLWFSVSDTGGGIPQETINRIFEPFYTTKKKGSGLGLMIVQRIVRDHRGRIELESRVNQGTTFRIWLPLHEPRPRLLEARLQEEPPDTNKVES